MTVIYERRELSRQVAHALAMTRASRGWTLKQAAQRCDCSISTIWSLENGQRVPSIALAAGIARVYELDRENTIRLLSEAVTNAGKDRPSKRKAKAAA